MNHPSLWLEREFSTLKDMIGDERIVHFGPDEIIYKQHDTLQKFYLIDRGIVKISIISEDGHEKIVGFQSDNSLFGMDCFCKPCSAVVTATAVADVYLYNIPHIVIESLIERNPGLGIELARYYSKLLKLMCLQTEYQSFHDALTRVVNYFLLYTKENDFNEHPIIRLTTEDIAALAATSRVNVSRVLKKLSAMEIIQKRRGQIIIKDMDKLVDICRLPCFDDTLMIQDF